MKIVIFVVSFVLQVVAISLSGTQSVSLVAGGVCLGLAVILAALAAFKYKSKVAYIPLLTGFYLFVFFVYHLFTASS